MNTPPIPPAIPPDIHPRLALSYELTRGDLFAQWMTILLRNRVLQVFVLAALLFNGWLVLGPELSTRPPSQTVFAGIVFLAVFLGCIAVCQCILGFASSFLLQQRGVVGKHVLEITEQGLVERTDFNETLHKWTSIGRIFSVCGYLYIYVSDMNSHVVPRRCFSPRELAEFEAEVRARAPQARSY